MYTESSRSLFLEPKRLKKRHRDPHNLVPFNIIQGTGWVLEFKHRAETSRPDKDSGTVCRLLPILFWDFFITVIM